MEQGSDQARKAELRDIQIASKEKSLRKEAFSRYSLFALHFLSSLAAALACSIRFVVYMPAVGAFVVGHILK
jgi:hypothetical protein